MYAGLFSVEIIHEENCASCDSELGYISSCSLAAYIELCNISSKRLKCEKLNERKLISSCVLNYILQTAFMKFNFMIHVRN